MAKKCRKKTKKGVPCKNRASACGVHTYEEMYRKYDDAQLGAERDVVVFLNFIIKHFKCDMRKRGYDFYVNIDTMAAYYSNSQERECKKIYMSDKLGGFFLSDVGEDPCCVCDRRCTTSFGCCRSNLCSLCYFKLPKLRCPYCRTGLHLADYPHFNNKKNIFVK